MSVADEFVALAELLARPAADSPGQASLRRAVSTAYYALFHLLVEEAAQRWLGSAEARQQLERALEYRAMRELAQDVARGQWKGWSASSSEELATYNAIPQALQWFGETFVEMQEQRHRADYNNAAQWDASFVQNLVARTRAAIDSWRAVRDQPIAGDYLLALLIGRRRR